VQNGAADPFIKPEPSSVQEGDGRSEVDYRYISYPGAVHAFTIRGDRPRQEVRHPDAYNAEADRKSMAEATSFFAGVFK